MTESVMTSVKATSTHATCTKSRVATDGKVRLGLALMWTSAAVGLSPVVMPIPALAQSSAVDALVKQAQYWRSKGRGDLAEQAMRRARALDPNNAALKASAPAPVQPPRTTSANQTAGSVRATTPAKAPATQPQSRVTARSSNAAAASGPVTGNVQAGRARVAGFAALEAGNLSAAAGHFQRALGYNRRDTDALGGLGLVRLRESHFAEAASLLGQASQGSKGGKWAEGLASARFFSGLEETRGLIAANRLSEAQEKAESLIRSGYSEPALALELLADIYERQGRFADAADLYRQASQGGSTSDDKRLQLRATRGRALAAVEQGDDITAMREFQSGLVLDPTDPWIRYEFAQFQIKRGRIPEAESLIRSLAAVGKPDALYAAALLNDDLGRTQEAERLIGMIPETQRTSLMQKFVIGLKTDSAIVRAKSMAASGQVGEALTSLRQLGAMPSIPVGKQVAIANTLFDLGDVQGAEQIAQQAMNGQIGNVEEYEGLTGILARVGRIDLAQMALERANAMAGSSLEGQRAFARINAGMMISQADAARQSGRFAESFDILQQAYQAAPENTEILSALARLYQTGGMPARAAQSYQLVLNTKPNDKDALLGLADTAQAAGDGALSKQAQEQVLRSYGQDYRVLMAIANVERSRGNDRAASRLLKDARDIYTRQHGGLAMGGNPFSAGPSAGVVNPFRDQQSVMATQVNPFALGNGTRLPAMQRSSVSANYPPQMAVVSPPDRYSSPTSMNPVVTSPSTAFAGSGWGGQSTSVGYPARDMPGVPVAFAGDPVMMQIQSQISELSQDSGLRVDVDTGYRSRSGEVGLSQMDEIKGSAKVSTSALSGRVFVKAEAVVIDAGKPQGSGLARFGTNATAEAQAIVDQVKSPLVRADSQQASGVAFSVGYESDSVQAEVGTTPVGMGKTQFAGRLAVSPEVSPGLRVKAFAERKPVTDSVLSYAGTRDPGTRDPVTGEVIEGERWGQVMRDGAGLGLSFDEDGSGIYGEGRYYRFRGHNVVKNDGIEANVGGYLRAYRGQNSAVTVGLNVNYQRYDKSQNYFTFGNGGYFSPQSFISVGAPVQYTYNDSRWDVLASFTPGFQSYKENTSPLYPLDADAQIRLEDLKLENDDVRSEFDSNSKTGFALSAQGSAYYKLSPRTRIGGDMIYNTFGSYDEFRSMLGVRQSLGNGK